jgi:tetratricopeptide (TPR) repeat protein
MKAIILINAFVFLFFSSIFSQQKTSTKTLTPEETKALLNNIKIDSSVFISSTGNDACKCIEKLYKKNNKISATDDRIIKCIEEKVTTLQTTMQMLSMMTNTEGNKTITINTDKGSDEFKKYYHKIEEWLKDSCEKLNIILRTNEEKGDNSVSNNKAARKEYDKGTVYLTKKEYEKALPYFEKAVQVDPVFAFAWDNIGVCNRNLGNYEKAENAYKESLKLDPSGKTALQNIAIVYTFQKKTDQAIEAYKNILKYYPNDAEVYYGIGSIYYDVLKDDEKALDYLCKAYNIYVKEKSAYRVDAQTMISYIYNNMKKANKEDSFKKILKDNNINFE